MLCDRSPACIKLHNAKLMTLRVELRPPRCPLPLSQPGEGGCLGLPLTPLLWHSALFISCQHSPVLPGSWSERLGNKVRNRWQNLHQMPLVKMIYSGDS